MSPPIEPRERQPPTPRLDEEDARFLLVHRKARERFGLDEALFGVSGQVVFADLAAARDLATRLAQTLEPVDPGLAAAITPARLYALGLVHELLHQLIDAFRREVDPEVLSEALAFVSARLGAPRLEAALRLFVEEFPPPAVYRSELSPDAFLAATTAGRSNQEVVLEEMLLLWLANSSPAFAPFRELFDDGLLRRATVYPELVAELETFLASRPGFTPQGQPGTEPRSLFALLSDPALVEPFSLSGQLDHLRETLSPQGEVLVERALRGADFLREEQKPAFPPGPGPAEVPPPAVFPEGPERFTEDRSWMPELVLVAKNTLVWLHQLSEEYGRPITTLDLVPDRELDLLAERGFTGLWLIGIWERSAASERIKRLCGNPEAAASAYSIASYRVAAAVGGDTAAEDLAVRARARGIRLGVDMVPNHMGIDSEWVLRHPERFLRLPSPPFPVYRFTGPDLSPDPVVGLYLEDHYYDRSDAAVVFERRDRETGEVAYLYHGNDGTSTPWNDTAQLDYLLPEVRAAAMEEILSVAKRFPIVRFDAAMTLAKRHFRRLWYPPPGEGGDIPSRSEHGLSEAEFERRMPEELWRQVVDRAAVEAPDTLLLAEAFWLMENYFVRSLGMHRVYNSAFMVMLRDERNAEYRRMLADVLAFDTAILQRYVNFMSNPDERTAVDQFGTGEKYFGIATLMASLPGLPMFGHGQIEGYEERYGMEYRRSYLAERPKDWLIARHQRQIAPLLARRRLFAGAEHFRLYDFERGNGAVDEDVFAFSNQLGGERALVVMHNRATTTSGRIRRSVLYAVKRQGAKPLLKGETLGSAFALAPAVASEHLLLLRCRDAATGLEHVFIQRELAAEGLAISLGPYEHHVFLDFEEVADEDGSWMQLASQLAGRGVPSLDEARREPRLEGVLAAFGQLMAAAPAFADAAAEGAAPESTETWDERLEPAVAAFEEAVGALGHGADVGVAPGKDRQDEESRCLALAHDLARASAMAAGLADLPPWLGELAARPATWTALYAALALRRLAPSGEAAGWLSELLLHRPLRAALAAAGAGAEEEEDAVACLGALLSGVELPLADLPLGDWLETPAVAAALRLHRFGEARWVRAESLRTLLALAALLAAETEEAVAAAAATYLAAETAGFQVEALAGLTLAPAMPAPSAPAVPG
ncbi:MAG TPA: alpha-amylase family glycosyl hydrolase [Thermoanaerobaculia bacterium]|nr:alpha-amylase family glycosyl hydrolase [Thermoanaerobaculia bacterium]